MIPFEFGEVNIRTNVRPKLNMETMYKPQYIPVTYLLKYTTIDKSTIYTWCRKGKIKFVSPTKKPCLGMKINTKDFADYVLKNYRYPLVGQVGKRWTQDELNNIDNSGRTKASIKIMKIRQRGQQDETTLV